MRIPVVLIIIAIHKKTANGYVMGIKNIGGFVAPVDVIINYNDGTKDTLHQTPAIWTKNQQEASVAVSAKKKIQSVLPDGG
jgi:hypothetical protein